MLMICSKFASRKWEFSCLNFIRNWIFFPPDFLVFWGKDWWKNQSVLGLISLFLAFCAIYNNFDDCSKSQVVNGGFACLKLLINRNYFQISRNRFFSWRFRCKNQPNLVLVPSFFGSFLLPVVIWNQSINHSIKQSAGSRFFFLHQTCPPTSLWDWFIVFLDLRLIIIIIIGDVVVLSLPQLCCRCCC